MGDSKFTGNIRKHVKKCWGHDVVQAAEDAAKPADKLYDITAKGSLKVSSITAAFKRTGKGKVTYSHRQHTKLEVRVEIVRWVSESMQLFKIVNDYGFQSLVKMGRPEYYIPLPTTVSHDVKKVFVK